jgi:hypothetical protein
MKKHLAVSSIDQKENSFEVSRLVFSVMPMPIADDDLMI